MNTTILRTLPSISGKNTALPHESACCVESLLPSKPQQQGEGNLALAPPATAPVATTTKTMASNSGTFNFSLTASTKLLLKQLVFKAMNAHETTITTKSNSKSASPTRKAAPASPIKVPGQLPSFPSNTTVDTMCSQEEEEDEVRSTAEEQEHEQEQLERKQGHQQLHYVGAEDEDEDEDEEEEEHVQDAAGTRAFAYLEELSQPKQPMVAPLKKVQRASHRWHLSLLHTEEEVQALLPVRVLV